MIRSKWSVALLGATALAASLATSAHAQSAPSQAEIDSLRAQVEAMQAQLQALTQATADNNAKVIADGDATKSLAAKLAKPFDNTTISGRFYYNASGVTRFSDGLRNERDGGFAIKRFYLGIDHKFNDTYAVDLTSDVDTVVGTTNNIVGKGYYIKKAYLEAKYYPWLNFRVGSADLPWVPFVEGLYGYRHIENILIDRTKFGTSADWGGHVYGSFLNNIISYQISAVDGGGYRDPHFSKTIDLEGRVSATYKGFVAAVGGYTGKLGKDTQGVAAYHTATRFDAVGAYKNKLFTVGAEYYFAHNWTQVTSTVVDGAEGYSLFGSVNPMKKISVFGRYDFVRPKVDTLSKFHEHYFNVGAQYSPAKIVDIALVYKRDSAVNGILSTSNGNIGGKLTGTYDEIGLFGQVRF